MAKVLPITAFSLKYGCSGGSVKSKIEYNKI
jgi:hypothetical protein